MGAGAESFRGTERFELAYRIGAGGMGVVYAALDREKNTRVALKTIKVVDTKSIARFKNEFRQLADVGHPNLVRLGELICAQGTWFFTMELIEGQSFLRYVAAPNAPVRDDGDASPTAPTEQLMWSAQAPAWFEEKKLRPALAQLCLGVSALHGVGKVHRDVKPSNILVTEAGRVVLLDFGLVTDAKREVQTGGLVGTARYMAPEQGAEENVGPAADWYAVGVVLYEALTGRAPFAGTQMQILMAKLQFDPPAPRGLAGGVPDDLNDLCLALLARDPKARPREAEIFGRLGLEAPSRPLSVSTASSLTESAPFVGRAEELATLRQAWEDSHDQAVVMVVRGESGIGKSSLVRRFVEALKQEQPELLVLAGRCYERESVPYKAFDAVMDTLSQHLVRMDPVQAAFLLTREAAPLARIFPVLRRCAVMSKIPDVIYPDPQEMRSRAFAIFRQLFLRLAEQQPVVVCIDDLQWTDGDSLTLLGDLLHPPEPPRLLLLATQQTGLDRDPLAEVSGRLGAVRHLELGGLLPVDAGELVGKLRPAAGPERVAKVTAEAGGHPLYLIELLLHGEKDSDLLLDDLLGQRIRALPEPAQRLLEVLALAGIPLRQATCAEAAGLEPEELARQVSLLRVAHFVRGTGARGREALETYHSRVRLAVVRRLSDETLARHHGSLARSLEASGEDPLALIRHLEGSGDSARAAAHAVRAAEKATEAMAFDQSAEFYRTALRVGNYDREPRRALLRGLGDALASAGRGRLAADEYQQAAQGADPAEALDLHRKAAEQLLRAGHIDEGIAVLEPVLASSGLRLARSNRQALAAAAWWYLRIRLRGLAFKTRKESEIPLAELRRIDLCWAVVLGLSHADHFRTADFQLRYLALALRAGEPVRVVRGLSMLAILAGAPGSRRGPRLGALLLRMEQIAQESGDLYSSAFSRFIATLVAMFAGQWSEMHRLLEGLEPVFQERCRGALWEVTTCRMVHVSALFYTGAWKELAARQAAWLREADERQDAYASAWTRCGHCSCTWLMRDETSEARREARRAADGWSKHGLFLHAGLQFISQVTIALYSSPTSPEAWQAAVQGWPVLQRSMLLRFQQVLIDALGLRARAALAAAAGAQGRDRETFVRHAEKAARKIEREKSPWGNPMALLVRAAVARLRGFPDRALSLLTQAATQFDQADMPGHAAIARFRLGQLLCGDQGQALVVASVVYMQSETIRNPARWADLLAPGFAQRVEGDG